MSASVWEYEQIINLYETGQISQECMYKLTDDILNDIEVWSELLRL